MKNLLLAFFVAISLPFIAFYSPAYAASNPALIPSVDSIAALETLKGPPQNTVVNVVGYYAGSTVGGGLLKYSTTGTVDNCMTFAASDGKYWKRQQSGPLYVSECGAKGDGTTDDTTAEQAALDAAPAGSVVIWGSGTYKTTATLTVTKSLKLLGPGTIKWTTTNIVGMTVTASNVTIDGNLSIQGPQYATYTANEFGVWAHGTRNAGLAPTYITNFTINNSTISSWGSTGLEVDYVQNFQSSDLVVNNVGYTGIGTESVQGCTLNVPQVSNVTATGDPSSNAYGITLSKATDDSGNLTSQPRTTNCTLNGPIVTNVPGWIGIDSHCGQNIAINGPVVQNAYFTIHIGACNNSAGTSTYPFLNVSVSGGSLDSGVTNGTHSGCVLFVGANSAGLGTGSISGVTMQNCGLQATNTDGAIQAEFTSGLTIVGNQIYDASPVGIAMQGYNKSFSISGNAITSPWSTSAGAAWGMRLTGDYNIGYIGSNSLINDGNKTATYVLTQGIALSAGTGENVQLGQGKNDATVMYVGTFSSALFLPSLPTSCTGQPAGAAWNNANVVNICP